MSLLRCIAALEGQTAPARLREPPPRDDPFLTAYAAAGLVAWSDEAGGWVTLVDVKANIRRYEDVYLAERRRGDWIVSCQGVEKGHRGSRLG